MQEKLTEHYNNNHEKLAKQAGRRLNDSAYGQDCVQESYLIALKYLDSYTESKGTFDQWFGRIFTRTLTRYKAFIRDKGVTKEFSMKDVEIPMEDFFQKYPELLKDALDDVQNPDHRIILNLYLKGYNGKEIKELSGYNTATVFQVVKRFKVKLAGYFL